MPDDDVNRPADGDDLDATKPLPKAEPSGEPGTEVFGVPDDGGAREVGMPGANPLDHTNETVRLEAINTHGGGHNAALSGGSTAPVASHVPIATASAATGGAGGLPPTPAGGDEGGRSPWPWVIGAIVLIALIAIAVAFALGNNGGDDDVTPSTTPKPRPSVSVSPAPSEPQETQAPVETEEPTAPPVETPTEPPVETPAPPAPTQEPEPAPTTPAPAPPTTPAPTDPPPPDNPDSTSPPAP